jgi:predicted membrane-bound mannosyltransferase
VIKKIIEYFGGRGYAVLLTMIVLIGSFLRFYKLGEFITFLGDQGRDAIIVRRLITFEHFPAIGPVTSIGGIFLGPFYYYFIAPWILLFNFDPVGLACGVAFMSSVFLVVQYLMVKNMFDKKVALISVCFVAFSWTLIEFSRFSWNPNLLPHFMFLTVWASFQAFQTRKLKYYALVGITLAIDVQLHYLALFALPAAAVLLMVDFISSSGKIKFQIIKGKLVALGSFTLLCAPLVVFDLKHEYLNYKNFTALIGHSSTLNRNVPVELLNAFTFLNGYVRY